MTERLPAAAADRGDPRKPQRYDFVLAGSGYYTSNEMERADDGEWIRFEDVEAQIARLTASVEALTQENLELRGRQEALDRSSEVALWTTLEDLRVHAYAADCTPAENFGFLLGEVERLLCQLAAAEAEREALITAVGQIAREMQAYVDYDATASCWQVEDWVKRLVSLHGQPPSTNAVDPDGGTGTDA